MLLLISLLPVVLQRSVKAQSFLLTDSAAAALVKAMFATSLQRRSLKALPISLLPYFTYFIVSPLEEKLCDAGSFVFLFSPLQYSLA